MKKILITIIIALLICFSLYSLEEDIVLGLNDHWSMLESSRNIEFLIGADGFQDAILKENEHSPDSNTDMLINFNSAGVRDEMGNYALSRDSIFVSDSFKKTGQGSGVFRGEKPGLTLEPGPDSMFMSGNVWNDFTIEFWMYSAGMKNGESVFLFKGSRIRDKQIIPQRIECKVEENRLVWIFENVFLPEDQGYFTITVKGGSMQAPRSWRNHQLRFDSETGLIEYVLDGKPEGISYANRDGRESGQVYLPYIGKAEKGSLFLGIELTAVLDEFRISSVLRDYPELSEYGSRPGEIISRYIDLSYSNSKIVDISADYETPGNSAIIFYYRTGNNYADTFVGDAEWIQFDPESVFFKPPQARYLQLKSVLFPDGTGTVSPRLTSLKIKYIPDLPPLPPEMVFAEPGNGKITLNWTPVAEEDVGGYLVYFGDRPGRYLGKTAANKISPINAGAETSITLDNLVNGQLYYFSICAYDKASSPHIGGFSYEVNARPSGLTGE